MCQCVRLLLLLLQDSTFSYNTRPSINPACCGCTSCVCPPPAPAILLSYWSFAGHTGTSLVQLPGASATMILENVQLLGSVSVSDWLPPAANYMDGSHTWVPGNGGAKYPGPGQGVRNGGAGAALAISELPGWGVAALEEAEPVGHMLPQPNAAAASALLAGSQCSRHNTLRQCRSSEGCRRCRYAQSTSRHAGHTLINLRMFMPCISVFLSPQISSASFSRAWSTHWVSWVMTKAPCARHRWVVGAAPAHATC